MTLRPGFALVVSVLMILALAMLGLGVLSLGSREALIAFHAERAAGARAAVELAARRELAVWSTAFWDTLAPGAVADGRAGPLPGPSGAGPAASTRVERLDSGLFLVRAEASRARAALLVRALPVAWVEEFFPTAFTPAPGEPGPIDLLVASGVATHVVTATTAAPAPEAGAEGCVTGAFNWGATSPGHPCRGLRPVVLARNDLIMIGGEARGVLIVDGDLVLDGDARFEGAILARGRVTVGAGAHVTGAVRAAELDAADGTVIGDPALVRHVLGAPALDRPFRAGSRWWVPVF